ncbi:MFS general substrate transporter [Lentinula edodes]|uniref:MFS general substrate transporter n=1 Tax=Lentinula edodes TaxID=5353 RepID=UPI001E8DF46B|nr:MFS general substrate transporter [Lentinula edodes]KAH7878915.1 MFS general substrate transporter [Lentinula edodes]
MPTSTFQVSQEAPDSPALDVEKTEVEQVENVLPRSPYQSKEPGPASILNWLQKKNPSPQFLADVAKMNETELDPGKVKHVERKIDLLIMPALAICYMFYYVDKTTLSYAAIFNIKEDLHLGSSDYSWLSSLFYFGWLGWALPTNLLMQKFPLNKYLAFNIFLWGILLMAQAASRNFTELAVLRVLSGAAEATADPAFVLITGTWYTRTQQPSRIGYWYLANGFGIALGGLFGYGIGHIKGSLPSWKYEFLIIGALCSVWAIFMAIFIPDSPYFSHWFTPEERLIIVSRKRGDYNSTDTREWKPAQVLEAFIDPKTYLFFLFGFTANVPNGATSNFGTLIVQGFGFDTFQTTLMQIPYGMVIVAFILAAIFINSKLPSGYRTLLMALTNVPTVVGFAMVAWCKGTAPRLAGFWMTGASNATFVLGLSLLSGNVGGQSKKAIASAAIFLGVAIGNIVGPFLFKTSEAPTYYTGVVGCLVSRALEIVVILVLRVMFIMSNRRRDRAVAEGRIRSNDQFTELEDITDWKNPAFRYVTVNLITCSCVTVCILTYPDSSNSPIDVVEMALLKLLC